MTLGITAQGGDTMRNLRDVGGLPVADGRHIRSGALYRGDAPLPGDGEPGLAAWPPRTVIDLRSSGELGDVHPLAGPEVEVISLPLSATANPAHLLEQPAALVSGLPALYRRILAEAPHTIASAVGLLASHDGPTLVHCTAGKDRTGLVMAATLSALGVPRAAVIADYARTGPNMPGVVERMADDRNTGTDRDAMRRLLDRRPELLTAPPTAIALALDAFDEAGGAATWLHAHGLPEPALRQLEERLVAI